MNETNNREESGHGKARKNSRRAAGGFEAVVFETAKEAADYLLSDMPAGETVGFGGCMTAKQMGLETLLRAAGHKVLWHWEAEPAERPRARAAWEAMNAPLV